MAPPAWTLTSSRPALQSPVKRFVASPSGALAPRCPRARPGHLARKLNSSLREQTLRLRSVTQAGAPLGATPRLRAVSAPPQQKFQPAGETKLRILRRRGGLRLATFLLLGCFAARALRVYARTNPTGLSGALPQPPRLGPRRGTGVVAQRHSPHASPAATPPLTGAAVKTLVSVLGGNQRHPPQSPSP